MRLPLLLWVLSSWTLWSPAQENFQVLATSRDQHSIQRFDAEGNYLFPFVEPSAGGLFGPEDILMHPDGSILVTGFGNPAIKRYDGITGAFLGNFSSGYNLNMPSKMSIGPDSLVYVTQWGEDKIVRFNLQGEYEDIYIDSGAEKGLGHVWDAEGNFYLSVFRNGGDGEVQKYDSSGNFLGVFASTAILQGPTSIWFDSQGDMLVEDWTVGNILRFDTQGNYEGVFTTGLVNPEGIAFLPGGDFLVGDWGLDIVHHISSNGVLLGNFTDTGLLDNPNCVFILPLPEDTTVAAGEGPGNVKQVSVWPVTGTDVFHIEFSSPYSGTVRILDASGRCVETLQNHGRERLDWHPVNVQAGVYFIKTELRQPYVPRIVVVK